MKWTNHARLQSAYAVRLVGWPPDVPMRNPSALTMVQNQTVLEALREARMRFERIGEGVMADVGDGASVESKDTNRLENGGDERHIGADVDVNVTGSEAEIGEADEDISWAYEYRGPSSSVSRFLDLILPNSTFCVQNPTSTSTNPLPVATRTKNTLLDSTGAVTPMSTSVTGEAGPSTQFRHQHQHHPPSPGHSLQPPDVHSNLTDPSTVAYDAERRHTLPVRVLNSCF